MIDAPIIQSAGKLPGRSHLENQSFIVTHNLLSNLRERAKVIEEIFQKSFSIKQCDQASLGTEDSLLKHFVHRQSSPYVEIQLYKKDSGFNRLKQTLKFQVF